MATFEKFVIHDSRVSQEKTAYSIFRGSSNITSQQYKSINPSPNKANFYVQAPSLNTYLNNITLHGEVIYQLTINITDSGGAYPAFGAAVINLQNFAFASHPLHRLIDTDTLTINGVPFPYQMGTMLESTLRFGDNMNDQYSTCPSVLDSFVYYSDASGATDNPMAGYKSGGQNFYPNGCYPRWQFCDSTGATSGAARSSNGGGAASAGYAWINASGIAVASIDGVNILTAATQLKCFVKLTSDEPLCRSPFNFINPSQKHQALSQINKIEWNVNFKADPSDCFQFVGLPVVNGAPAAIASTTLNRKYVSSSVVSISNMWLDVELFAPNEEDLLKVEPNIVPYLSFAPQLMEDTVAWAAGTQKSLTLQAVPLGKIPDGLLFWAQPKSYNNIAANIMSAEVGKFRYVIEKISVGFGQTVNQLSSFSKEQLWRMSYDNGVRIPYIENCGKAYNYADPVPAAAAPPVAAVLVAPAVIPLCGSLHYLKINKDIILDDPTLCAGCQGSFLLNTTVTISNQLDPLLPAAATQLYVVPVFSSFIVSEQGRTLEQSILVNQKDVIKTKQTTNEDSHVSDADLERRVGGGWLSKLGNIFKTGVNLYNASKPIISEVKKSLPDGKFKDVLTTVGYGHPIGAGKKTGGKKANLKNLVL